MSAYKILHCLEPQSRRLCRCDRRPESPRQASPPERPVEARLLRADVPAPCLDASGAIEHGPRRPPGEADQLRLGTARPAPRAGTHRLGPQRCRPLNARPPGR